MMCVDCMRMQPAEALSSLHHSQDPVYPATQATQAKLFTQKNVPPECSNSL